jgi:hypothetical protein
LEKEEKIMNGISLKYLTVCGILLFSLVYADEERDNEPVIVHLDLIQHEDQITVVGEVTPHEDITGARARVYIFRNDGSLVYTLLDTAVDLSATNIVTLKDLNNGEDITFSMKYLYGKYIVVMEISEGDPFLDPVRIEKDFQTKLIHLNEPVPIDIPEEVPESQQNKFYLPCYSSKVAEDLNEYFEFNWTEEKITSVAEEIESEIYPKYSQGISDLTSFLNDLNTVLELNLTAEQIDELVYALENGLFSPKTDAYLPPGSDGITESMRHPSDTSAPFLTGRNVIARIYVNDRNNTWTADDRDTAWQQVSIAASQIRNWAPSSANVSFVHVSFIATLNGTPNYSVDNPDKDWMEDVVYTFGYPSTAEFAKALKTTYNADHVIQLFLPHIDERSYALPYPSWDYGERACVFFYASCFIVCIRNDEGPYKHEALHLFGACDEYYESQCNFGCAQCEWAYEHYKSLYSNSGNCEYCMSNPVPCIMRSGVNDNHAMNDYICYYTRGQIGWGDYDGDGILDPFDLCPAEYGSTSTYGCPSFGMVNIPSLYASDNFHVVGDTAYCTDVLGTANLSWIFGYKSAVLPEGRTNVILPDKEHETGNLLITGGPAVNPIATEFGNYFGITYTYYPGVSFEIRCEGQSIFLNLQDYPQRDIAIVYLGREIENERNILIAWGYGWQGTYAATVLMSHPDVWSFYGSKHLLFLEWVDTGDGLVTWDEIHVVFPYPHSLSAPPSGSTSLTTPTFRFMPWLFGGNSFHVVGDTAYCTDVLGTANVSWFFGSKYISDSVYVQRPEGRTHTLLTTSEYQGGNLLITGGPAVNPIATEFGYYFDITYDYQPGSYFKIMSDGYELQLNMSDYPHQDICIIHLGRQNHRNVLITWGYGWQGTYAGTLYMTSPPDWYAYLDYHMVLLKWEDRNWDGLVQIDEIMVMCASWGEHVP